MYLLLRSLCSNQQEAVSATIASAKDTGLGRESLYKTFSADSKLRFETIMKVLDSFGVKLQSTV